MIDNIDVVLYLSDDKRTVGTAEAERVAEDGVDLSINSCGGDVKWLRILVGVLEVDVGGNEVMVHHNNAINNLTGTGHPTFMTGH